MPEIVLYHYAGDAGVESGSPFCVKVHRALAFKGLSYQVRQAASPATMKRINPRVRKVPVLEWDGRLVTDSSRILRFLDAQVPDPPLDPPGRRELALCRLVEDWADESLYWFAVYMRWAVDSNFQPFAGRAFGGLPVPVRWFLPSMLRRMVRRQLHGQGIGRLPLERVVEMFGEHLDMLEVLLDGRDFLAGGGPSAADLAVFGPLRACALPTSPQTAELVAAREPIVAWLRRVDRATSGEHTVAFEQPAGAPDM